MTTTKAKSRTRVTMAASDRQGSNGKPLTGGKVSGADFQRTDLQRSMPPGMPRTMPMGKFLFEYLHSVGVKHSFGVPGDFALPTFAWLDKSSIEHITMTHEPGAGF